MELGGMKSSHNRYCVRVCAVIMRCYREDIPDVAKSSECENEFKARTNVSGN